MTLLLIQLRLIEHFDVHAGSVVDAGRDVWSNAARQSDAALGAVHDGCACDAAGGILLIHAVTQRS